MVDVAALQPDDLFTLLDNDGHSYGVYEYIGPNEDEPDRVFARDVGNGETYAIRKDCIVLPSVVGVCTESVGDAGTSSQPGDSEAAPRGHQPLSEAQRRMIFGLGTSKGFDIDDLRSITPAGSISALTRAQAAKLIDTLTGKPGSHDVARGAQGTATGKQIGLIAHLRDLIGFGGVGFIAGCTGSSGSRRWATSPTRGWRRV